VLALPQHVTTELFQILHAAFKRDEVISCDLADLAAKATWPPTFSEAVNGGFHRHRDDIRERRHWEGLTPYRPVVGDGERMSLLGVS